MYRETESLPPAVIANKAMIDFETAVQAKLLVLRKEKRWWDFRDEANKVSPEAHAEAMVRIAEESTRLSALLPTWAHPKCYKTAATELATSWRGEYELNRRSRTASPSLPCVFPKRVNHLWRLSSCPRSGGAGAPDTTVDPRARVPETGNSSGESGE